MPSSKNTVVFDFSNAQKSKCGLFHYAEAKLPWSLNRYHTHILGIEAIDTKYREDFECFIDSAQILGSTASKPKQLRITNPFVYVETAFNPAADGTVALFLPAHVKCAVVHAVVWQPGPIKAYESPQLWAVEDGCLSKVHGEEDLVGGRSYRLSVADGSGPVVAEMGGALCRLAADGSTYGTFSKGKLGAVREVKPGRSCRTAPLAALVAQKPSVPEGRVLLSVTPVKGPGLGCAEVVRLREEQKRLKAIVTSASPSSAIAACKLRTVNLLLAPLGFTPL